MPSGSNTFCSLSIATDSSAAARPGRRLLRKKSQARIASTTIPSATPIAIQYCAVTASYLLLPGVELRRELREIGFDRDARGRPVEQLGQRGRHRNRLADDRLDDAFEFRRMRRRAHDPRLTDAPRGRQMIVDVKRRRRMRAPDLTVQCVILRDLRADLLVVDGVGLDRGAQLCEVGHEVAQALHVARIADVHCRGERRYARARLPLPGGEKLRDRAI